MKKRLLIIFLTLSSVVLGQDFLMQAWYWDYPKTIDNHNWADTLTNKARELADAGFTYIWLPPLSRASYGSGSNGYDPQDLFDLGEFGLGATGFGTRTDVDELIAEFDNVGINAVADVVYNHRDGGKPENNPIVEGWIENFTYPGQCAYPSDRVRYILPIGGSTGRGAGTYYFKIKSKTEHPDFFGKTYKFYVWTNTIGWQNLIDTAEVEPNGGGGCGETNNTVNLGRNWLASLDATGCKIDEFALKLDASDFNPSGDTIFCVLPNDAGYSDHYVYELWYNNGSTTINVQPDIIYQTYTDFTNLPSGRGDMNWENFKPNSSNSTTLCGDWDWPWFFYDYDQYVVSTNDSLFAWTNWLWSDVGIRGLRMDAVKHFPPEFVGDLFDYLHSAGIDPQLNVGEYFDANSSVLKNWVDQVYYYMNTNTKAAITPRVFDFSLRQALKDASDSYGYDVRNVFNSGIVDAEGMSGFNSVTFIDNHDLAKEGHSIQNDPILGYAYILTNNKVGLPTVFYPDYYTVPGFLNSGMKNEIDKLIDIHKKYIYNAASIDYLSAFGSGYDSTYHSGYPSTTLLYQIMQTTSGRDLIVCINYAGGTDTLNVTHGINSTNINPGDVFVELLNNAVEPFTSVDANSNINIKLPPRSYSVWIEGVTVKVKIFLEGPYNKSTGLMSTSLGLNNHLPLKSPYTQDGRTVSKISNNITDWILVELYDDMNNPPVVSKSAFVRNDGTIVLEDGITEQIPLNAPAGDYYLVLRHRNHLAIRSTNKLTVTASTPLYDFTTSASQSFNNGTKNINN